MLFPRGCQVERAKRKLLEAFLSSEESSLFFWTRGQVYFSVGGLFFFFFFPTSIDSGDLWGVKNRTLVSKV